jgi:outer membrane lipoprotein-sorting protein
MNPEDKVKKLITKSDIITNYQTEKKILSDALEHLDKFEQKSPGIGPHTWRLIMKSPLTKIAVTVTIIISIFIVINQFSNSIENVAFADVVKPILTARTATFKITQKIPKMVNRNGTFAVEGTVTIEKNGMFMEPGNLREEGPGERIKILDSQQHKMILFNTENKTAKIYEQDIPDEETLFNEMRKRIKQIQQTEDESIEFLGERKIEGKNAIGYRVEEPPFEIVVWANVKTLLPIRLEYTSPEMVGDMKISYVISEIVFDVELDKSLFSLEVPEEYTVEHKRMRRSIPTEKDLLDALSLWTNTTGGKFPSALNQKVVVTEFTMGEFRDKWHLFEKTIFGLMFPHMNPVSDWHYAGKDVKFGDGDTAVFWYRPEGSETYRVIYGDLNIKDVAPENLPE